MGWKTAFLLLESTPVDEVMRALPDVFVPTAQTIGWAAATSPALAPNLALAPRQGWAIVFDPNAKFVLNEQFTAPLSLGTRALAGVLHSTATLYGFAYLVDGTLTRKLLYQEQRLVEQRGVPLAAERGLTWSDGEAAVLALVQRIAGLDLSATDALFADAPIFRIAELDL